MARYLALSDGTQLSAQTWRVIDNDSSSAYPIVIAICPNQGTANKIALALNATP